MEIMKSTTRPASQTDELVDTKSSEAKNWRHPLRMQNERGKSDAVSLEMLILSTRGLGGAALLDSEAMAAIMIFLIDQILFLRGHTAASLQEMRRPIPAQSSTLGEPLSRDASLGVLPRAAALNACVPSNFTRRQRMHAKAVEEIDTCLRSLQAMIRAGQVSEVYLLLGHLPQRPREAFVLRLPTPKTQNDSTDDSVASHQSHCSTSQGICYERGRKSGEDIAECPAAWRRSLAVQLLRMSKWFLNSNTPKSHALSLFIVVRTRQSEPQRELRPQMSASVGKKSTPVSLRGSFVSQVPKGFRIMHNIQPRLPKVMPCIVLEGGPEAASAGHSGKSISSPLHPQEERLLVTGLTECTLISKIALKGLNALNRTGRTESQVAASTCRT